MSSDRDWLGTWLDELTCNGGVYASECGRPPDCSSCETCADHCHCGRDGSEGLEPFDARTLRPGWWRPTLPARASSAASTTPKDDALEDVAGQIVDSLSTFGKPWPHADDLDEGNG